MADNSTSEIYDSNKKNIITKYITNKYDLKNVSVGVIGSHSALEIMDGAKDVNLKTVCICQSRVRNNRSIVDSVRINTAADWEC